MECQNITAVGWENFPRLQYSLLRSMLTGLVCVHCRNTSSSYMQMRASSCLLCREVTTGSSEHSPTNRRTSGHLHIWLCWLCPTSPSPRPWGSSSPGSRKTGHLIRTGAGPKTIFIANVASVIASRPKTRPTIANK